METLNEQESIKAAKEREEEMKLRIQEDMMRAK